LIVFSDIASLPVIPKLKTERFIFHIFDTTKPDNIESDEPNILARKRGF
jgi:hypothetical protein